MAPARFIPFCAVFLWGLQAQPCRSCHPKETATFLATAMGRSFGDPVQQPDGRFSHELSKSTITIRHNAGWLEHRIDTRGLSGSYPVSFAIGAGKVGYSYIARLGDYLYQSPASFYSQTGRWDLTPGYEPEHRLDFTHQVSSGCLFCHAGSVRLVKGTDNRFEDPPFTRISCERCHGPSDAHLAHPSKDNIVNPAKLMPARRDAVCEQCHLEGEVRILNPGKSWWDFKPGQELENVFVTYLKSVNSEKVRAVSQSELLAESRCARSSAGKLWCGTCHNPHLTPDNREPQVRQICLNCHASLFAEAKHPPAAECVSCHMPRLRPDDVAHAAVTDHRIPKRAAVSERPPSKPLHAWREPQPEFQKRDLGLAYYEMAASAKDPQLLRHSYELLSQLPPGARDAPVLADLGSILLSQHFNDQALRLFEQAAAAQPRNARYAYVLGMAFERAGNTVAAQIQLRQSIQLDPSQPDPYVALAGIYETLGQSAQKRQVLQEYLKFMPQNLSIRTALR